MANNIDPVPFTAGTVLINPVSASTTPNFRPVPGSPALSGTSNFVDNCVLENLFVTASDEIDLAKFAAVFPNPVSNGDLYFGREVVSFGIFNTSGQLVGQGFNTDRADINGLPLGIYFIKLEGRMQKFAIQ